MSRVAVSRTIQAPPATVFDLITNIEALPDTNPDVVKVEFLTEQRSGAGTRFLETRRSKKREMVTELELTELVDNESARFVSDMGGTVWDTAFRVRPAGAGSELEIDMEARPYKLLARLMYPLIKGMVRRGMEKHIDEVRATCERRASASAD